MKNYALFLTFAFVTLALSACSSTREQFDFSKKAPDEFAVTTRAPLEMPTDFNSLPPPRLGAPRPQEDSPTQEARQALFGENSNTLESVSKGEDILLRKTGADTVAPSIRDTIDRETATLAVEKRSTFDRIMGRVGRKTEASASVVDPVKESERILKNKQAGKPVTDGKTPTINE